jgi:hypothetical protein
MENASMPFAIRHKPTNKLLRARTRAHEDCSLNWNPMDSGVMVVETELTADDYPDTIWLVDRRDDCDKVVETGEAPYGDGRPFIEGFRLASTISDDEPLLGWQKSSDDYEVVEIKLSDYHWPEID